MNYIALAVLILLLLAHLIVSLLATMQARRFRYLSKFNSKFTWSYMIIIGIIDTAALSLFFLIDWGS